MARRLVLLSLLGLLCAGCESLFPEGSSRSRNFLGVPKLTPYKVWEHLQEAVNEEYDIRLASDEEMELETEWNEHLAPMYKMGRRYMAVARVVSEPGDLHVEVTVRRERNANLRRPLDKREADWESDGRDEPRERKILWLVTMRLVKFAPSARSLHPEKSKYLSSEEAKRDRALWSDGGGGGGGSGGSPDGAGGSRKDLWKD